MPEAEEDPFMPQGIRAFGKDTRSTASASAGGAPESPPPAGSPVGDDAPPQPGLLAEMLYLDERYPVLFAGSATSGKSTVIISLIYAATRSARQGPVVDVTLGGSFFEKASELGETVKVADLKDFAERFFHNSRTEFVLARQQLESTQPNFPVVVPLDLTFRDSKTVVKIAIIDGRGGWYEPTIVDGEKATGIFMPISKNSSSNMSQPYPSCGSPPSSAASAAVLAAMACLSTARYFCTKTPAPIIQVMPAATLPDAKKAPGNVKPAELVGRLERNDRQLSLTMAGYQLSDLVITWPSVMAATPQPLDKTVITADFVEPALRSPGKASGTIPILVAVSAPRNGKSVGQQNIYGLNWKRYGRRVQLTGLNLIHQGGSRDDIEELWRTYNPPPPPPN